MDMMTVIGQRVSRPLPMAPLRGSIPTFGRKPDPLPLLAWPVCWELLSDDVRSCCDAGTGMGLEEGPDEESDELQWEGI